MSIYNSAQAHKFIQFKTNATNITECANYYKFRLLQQLILTVVFHTPRWGHDGRKQLEAVQTRPRNPIRRRHSHHTNPCYTTPKRRNLQITETTLLLLLTCLLPMLAHKSFHYIRQSRQAHREHGNTHDAHMICSHTSPLITRDQLNLAWRHATPLMRFFFSLYNIYIYLFTKMSVKLKCSDMFLFCCEQVPFFFVSSRNVFELPLNGDKI